MRLGHLLRSVLDRLRDRRRRWRRAWTGADARILALASRDGATGRPETAGRDGPYRGVVAGRAGGERLASLVYAGDLVDAGHAVVRRIEIDPHDGHAWLLWQHRLEAPLAESLLARAGSIVLVPSARGLEALDLFTGRRRWEVPLAGAARDALRLADGALLVWSGRESWVEIEPDTGHPRARGHDHRPAGAELTRGAVRLYVPEPRPPAEVLVAGHLVTFSGALEVRPVVDLAAGQRQGPVPEVGRLTITGCEPLGRGALLDAGGLRLLALVRRRAGFEAACAVVDLATLSTVAVAPLGPLPSTTTVEQLELLDGLAFARLHLDDGAHATLILDPHDGALLCRIDRSGARLFHAGRPGWLGSF